MFDIITITGETLSVHGDYERARMIAAPMEHHRVVDDMGGRYAFAHLPRPRMGQPSHVERYAKQHMRQRIIEILAEHEALNACDCRACTTLPEATDG